MKNATFRQLRVFNEVARHLSFIRAAEALHLTPPAVTMQIKELEGHLGMALCDPWMRVYVLVVEQCASEAAKPVASAYSSGVRRIMKRCP